MQGYKYFSYKKKSVWNQMIALVTLPKIPHAFHAMPVYTRYVCRTDYGVLYVGVGEKKLLLASDDKKYVSYVK